MSLGVARRLRRVSCRRAPARPPAVARARLRQACRQARVARVGRRARQAGGVDAEEALFGGDADAQGEAVVAGAAVDIEAVGAACPEAVIGGAGEEAEQGPG